MATERPYQHVVTRGAARQLRRCPRRDAILAWLEQLCRDPFRLDNNVKPLTDVEHGYRRRFGAWRVSYLVDRRARTIEDFEVAPRGGAYR